MIKTFEAASDTNIPGSMSRRSGSGKQPCEVRKSNFIQMAVGRERWFIYEAHGYE